MTQQMQRRPAGLGRAEVIVLGGLSLLVVAVVISWLGGKGDAPVTAKPSTQPLEVLEPQPLMTQETQIAGADPWTSPATLPATQPAAFFDGERILLPTD